MWRVIRKKQGGYSHVAECTFVILGATGDLTKRKLIPAIYHLVNNKKLDKFAIVGAARRDVKIQTILKEAKKFVKDVKPTVWNKIERAAYYHPLDFYKKEDYESLGKLLKQVEKKHNLKGNRIFYLATLPQHFDKITQCIAKCKLAKAKGWQRLVYEKPFGHDLKSAKKINRCISRIFKEKQIYRIDHYLGKELVANIALVRFTNRVLEPLWNNKHVEHVQIEIIEDMGVKGREDFYDKTGALRDVFQNHLLQVLALTAMDEPKDLKGEHVRTAKANVLKKVKIENVVLGQYRGYRKEVGRKSNTETFAAVQLKVNTPRWKGVPFYLKSGKKLDKREANIRLRFKKVKCLLDFCPRETNELEIRIQPDSGFTLKLNAKVPGAIQYVTQVKMDYCHECILGVNTPEAYELLLEDIIKGDQTVFVRNDEIEYSWKITDKIRSKRYKVKPYKPGSTGPKLRWVI